MSSPGDLPVLGRLLVAAGAILVAVGLLLLAAPHLPFLGRLPGDLVLRRKNFTLYVPLATSLLLSLLLTLLVRLFRK